MKDKSARLFIKVYGQVHGVSFRYYTKEKALSLGLMVTANNMDDGSVEIEAEGKRKKLEQLLEWAHHGPSLARVERVEYEWQ